MYTCICLVINSTKDSQISKNWFTSIQQASKWNSYNFQEDCRVKWFSWISKQLIIGKIFEISIKINKFLTKLLKLQKKHTHTLFMVKLLEKCTFITTCIPLWSSSQNDRAMNYTSGIYFALSPGCETTCAGGFHAYRWLSQFEQCSPEMFQESLTDWDLHGSRITDWKVGRPYNEYQQQERRRANTESLPFSSTVVTASTERWIL